MLTSAGYPADTLQNLQIKQINTLWDGIFHGSTYVFVHHVNETVPRQQWVYWDIGFLVWGVAMTLAGWAFLRRDGTKATETDC